MDNLEKLACTSMELIEDQIKALNKKGDAITPAEFESMYKAWTLLLMMQGLVEDGSSSMMSGRGYMYGTYGPEGMDMSGRRGRSPVTGRYVSRDDPYMHGYSGHSIKDRMIAKLESMYDEAKTEHERELIANEIKHLETEK